MEFFKMNREEVAKLRLEEAKYILKTLRACLDGMKEAMENHKSGAFPALWCSDMMKLALGVCNAVAQYNSAMLVHGLDAEPEQSVPAAQQS